MKFVVVFAVLSCLVFSVSGVTKLNIKLHAFSGRPDPQWTIRSDDRSFREIVGRLSGHVSTPLASRNGYCGFSIDAYRGNVMSGSDTIGMCREPLLERFLLNVVQQRVPDGAGVPLGAQVIQYVSNSITNC